MTEGTQINSLSAARAAQQLTGRPGKRVLGRSDSAFAPVEQPDETPEEMPAAPETDNCDETILRDALLKAFNAPDRIFDAQKTTLKMSADYERLAAQVRYAALHSEPHKNVEAAKIAIEYALANDEKLRQIEAGLNVAKARLERERNELDAARSILRVFAPAVS